MLKLVPMSALSSRVIRPWLVVATGLSIVKVAEAKDPLIVVPRINFIPQGGSVTLKARLRGRDAEAGCTWRVLDPGQGRLESISLGRVRFVATGAEPWSRVRVRATSLKDPSVHGDTFIEVLPGEVFGVIQQVLNNPHWIREQAAEPIPLRIEVIDPGFFSWSGQYTIHAELDTGEADRFEWKLPPGQGTLARSLKPEISRETVLFTPPSERSEDMVIRLKIKNLENPKYSAETTIRLEQNAAKPDAVYIPGLGPSIPGKHMSWRIKY